MKIPFFSFFKSEYYIKENRLKFTDFDVKLISILYLSIMSRIKHL